MRRADLSLFVSQRKLPCVLDPALALGHAEGPLFASRLVQVMEPWLPRSFWQVIDSSELLARSALQPPEAEGGEASLAFDFGALATWIRWRDSTDAGSWLFRWIGDNFAESQVQDAAEAGVVERYERLLEALTARCMNAGESRRHWCGFDPLHAAFDTLALSATLKGALLLSLPAAQPPGEPWPVQALHRIGVRTTQLVPMPEQSLFAAERAFVRQALAAAGLAAPMQSLPPLAVVHVLAEIVRQVTAEGSDDALDLAADPWGSAEAWWYFVQ
jgi:hypothetical protein